jgi:CRP-like cAMP-binding protein
MHRDQQSVSNRLLKALPSASFAYLAPHLETVDVPKHTVLIEPDTPPPLCLFYESGLGSVLAENATGQSVEIGLYGVDGFTGLSAILDAGHSPHRLVMQIGGTALGLPTPRFVQLLDGDPALARLMRRYVQYFSVQVAHTCLSNALHSIDVRLARWLLMSLDRMPDSFVPLTQEYLSLMLGCNRTTVTTALSNFAAQGIIRTARGNIEILDRAALRLSAAEAYGIPEREYDRLIAPFFGNEPETDAV